jgi:hypothetical protein
MLVHVLDEPNANELEFTTESTMRYMNTLLDMPLVAKTNVEETNLKGHEPQYDRFGNIVKLDTIPIGVITDVWIQDYQINNIEYKKALMAKAKVWSYKFPNVYEIIQKLFESGNLATSVEVAIFSFEDLESRKAGEYEYLGNCLLGEGVMPADSNAGVKLIAQALVQDISEEGGNQVDETIKDEVVVEQVEEVVEVQEEVEQVQEQPQEQIDLNELLATLAERDNSINELTSIIATKEEEIASLNATIQELKAYKDKFESEQIEKEIAEIRSKYSKILSKEKLESEEVQQLINERNVAKLNDLVVEELANKTIEETTQPKEDVVINSLGNEFQQLLEDDLKTKYLS